MTGRGGERVNNCEKALAAVADAIARQAEHESKPEGLLLLAQAAASITEADKMVSGNLVKPLGATYRATSDDGSRLVPKGEVKGQVIPSGIIH